MTTYASHRICCRSSPAARRYRTTIATTAAAIDSMSPTHASPRECIGREPLDARGIAQGDRASATNDGERIEDTAATTPKTIVAGTRNRQRGPGTRPVGNNRPNRDRDVIIAA